MKSSTRQLVAWTSATALICGLSGCGAEAPESSTTARAVAPPPSPERVARSQEVLLQALEEQDPFERAKALATVLPTLGPEAIPRARQALEDRAYDRGAVEVGLLLGFWALHHPQAASQWALDSAPLAFRAAAISVALEAWARVDPQAVAAKVKQGAAGAHSEAAQIALIKGWFASGKPGIEDYSRRLGVSFERQRALRVFAREMIRRDGTQAAMRWAESLPDEPERFKLAAFRQVATELTVADPTSGVAWCDAHCDGPFGGNIMKLVAQRWAVRDGRAALEWLANKGEGTERMIAIRLAYGGWLGREPEAARAWLEAKTLEERNGRFLAAAEVHAFSIIEDRPLDAIRWASELPDESKREGTIVVIARRWRAADPSAADAWLDRSPLSEEARAHARKPREEVNREIQDQMRARRAATRDDLPVAREPTD